MKLGNRIVMTLAGLLLAAAALLKFHEVLTVYIPSWREHGIWESYEFFLFQIPLEFALGVWIVSGVFRKASWLAATGVYFAFIFVTLTKALTGAESCGCFGRIHVNPWYTLTLIDIPFFVLLLIFRPKGEKLLPPPWPHPLHALATAVPAIGFMAIAAPVLVALRPEFKKPEQWSPVAKPVKPVPIQKPSEEPTPPPQIQPAPAEPSKADGEQPAATPWPWLQYIDIADQLKNGVAVILMYHHDCPTCAQMVPLYDEYAKKMAQQGETLMTIAFVAIPPYSESGPVPADTPCLKGRLSDKQKWAIMSPYVVALVDGGFVKDWPQGTAPQPETLLDEIFEHP
ncbi:MAG TPA: hypothetical protein PK054_05860 [Anaerohalosphaeraceae bacterium]|nr:hypothetical protein [Anaerohalosphaeraceae bacterium]HOL88233.1 hypothetical protein [Anaerohalosphaeraceae bacterium]HPP56092.1 hypothetical protein [Anaerohalosphaeraceae bacterium]